MKKPTFEELSTQMDERVKEWKQQVQSEILKEYFEWCAERGIAKKTIHTFAKERGIPFA